MSKDITQITATPGQTSASNLPAIEVRDLCKSFKDFHAVDHLSLSVRQGEIFGLLGPNGSGKTTTINMISGLSVPTSGEVRVMGNDVRHKARQVHQILGSVPQETALYEELTAWANMDFHADLFGIPRKEKKVRITKLLELVQLQDRKDLRVGTFSGGMKRRLASGTRFTARSATHLSRRTDIRCGRAGKACNLGLHPFSARPGKDCIDYHQLS